ncbi:MAG TPA: hypothetical protein VFR35_15680 [Actinoplanes sp.]|nr:hypothetical protein [Actinoplanes sp.]
MTVRRLSVPLALVAVLVTGGCAGAGESGTPAGAPASPASPPASASLPASAASPPPSASSPASAGLSASPPASGDLPGELPRPGSLPPGTQTLSGTVTSGVEPGCLLLSGGAGSHLLIFDDAALRSRARVGTKITVTGRAEPDMMTTCQQGTPFLVAAVRPN